MLKKMNILIITLVIVLFVACKGNQMAVDVSSTSNDNLEGKPNTLIPATVRMGIDEEGEPIEWLVLDKKNGEELLLSKYVLTKYVYNEIAEDITWETSSIRKWLNSEYINKIFSEDDRKRILITENINKGNEQNGTNGGNNTQDKLFLLSVDELQKYLSGNEKCTMKDGTATGWWLRTPGAFQDAVASVDIDGTVLTSGFRLIETRDGIRPALWVKQR